MDDASFGQRAPAQNPMRGIASAHANLIADSIEKGWIMRGLKLGIGFWLAGLLTFIVSALLWVFVIGAFLGAVTQFHRAGDAAQMTAPPEVDVDVGYPIP